MNNLEKLKNAIEEYEKETDSVVVSVYVKRVFPGIPVIQVVSQEHNYED